MRTLVIWITDVGWLARQFIVHHGMEADRYRTIDLQLAVIDSRATQFVAFPCRRVIDNGWLDVETNKQVHYVLPTHWRDWTLN